MILKFITAFALAIVPVALGFFPFWSDFTRSIGSNIGINTYGIEMTNYLQGYTEADATNYYAVIFNWTYYAPLVTLVVYYYVVDKSRFRASKYWSSMLLLGVIVAASKAFLIAQTGRAEVRDLMDVGIAASGWFAFLVALLAFAVGFVQSLCLRPNSVNCAKTPFRESKPVRAPSRNPHAGC